jgi:hypothetical protein
MQFFLNQILPSPASSGQHRHPPAVGSIAIRQQWAASTSISAVHNACCNRKPRRSNASCLLPRRRVVAALSTRTYQNPVQPEYRYLVCACRARVTVNLSPPHFKPTRRWQQHRSSHNRQQQNRCLRRARTRHPSECAHVEPILRMNAAASAAVPHPLPMRRCGVHGSATLDLHSSGDRTHDDDDHHRMMRCDGVVNMY